MAGRDGYMVAEELWNVAKGLGDNFDGRELRALTLSLLVLRFLSDRFEWFLADFVGGNSGEFPVAGSRGKGTVADWYRHNPDLGQDAEEAALQSAVCILAPGTLWSDILACCKNGGRGIAAILRTSLGRIDEWIGETGLGGLSTAMDLDSKNLGRSKTERSRRVAEFALAVDEVLPRCVSAPGKAWEVFEELVSLFEVLSSGVNDDSYTPRGISDVLAGMAAADIGETARSSSLEILDFACGSGSLLLNVRDKIGSSRIGKLYGQDVDADRRRIALMSMTVCGLRNSDFDVFLGDSLSNKWPILQEEFAGGGKKFDVVVGNPPFDAKWNPKAIKKSDTRFMGFGVPPSSGASFAFILHGIHCLKEDGFMATVMPYRVLFRGGPEGQIRKMLLDRGHVDSVIGMPGNLLQSTGLPVCILVLRKSAMYEDVLFVNASGPDEFEANDRQVQLEDARVEEIVSTWRNRPGSVPGFARRVEKSEIASNDFVLDVDDFIRSDEMEPEIDTKAAVRDLSTLDKKLRMATKAYAGILKELETVNAATR